MKKKKIALAADQNRLHDLLDWAAFNRDLLLDYEMYTTQATASALSQALGVDVDIFQFNGTDESVPRNGSNQENGFDLLVLFLEPAELSVVNADIKALLHLATLKNIPIAGNRTSADFMFPSYLM